MTGRLVTWSSSNPAVATVEFRVGLATGVAVGTATITATSEGKSGTATLTVNPVPVASVSITPPSPDTVFIGYTTQLTAVDEGLGRRHSHGARRHVAVEQHGDRYGEREQSGLVTSAG